MEEHRMLKAHDRVVVGVSGGADSVCLFLLLSEYAKRVPLSLAAVHVNHGIRREAGEDARFVEELCREKGVPFFLEERNVREFALRHGYSEEDAGRRVRYDAFFRTAERLGGARIAVAHNSNDNAETMLFHLFRGSGLRGLGGIAPVRGDIIRPILCLERQEVEAYLRSVSAGWCLDLTNQGDDYRRNRIRHHILPYAEEAVTAGAVGHMGRTAELLRETEDYLEMQTGEALKKCAESVPALPEGGEEPGVSGRKPVFVFTEGGEEPGVSGREVVPALTEGSTVRIDVALFRRNHTILQKRMLLKLLNGLSPTGKDIGAVHVSDTLELFEREGNRRICLPFGIGARRQYDSVFLERAGEGQAPESGSARGKPPDAAEAGRCERPITVSLGEEIFRTPAVYDLGDWGKIECMGFFLKKGQEVPIKQYTKWFDYDKIKECVVIRSRCQGDYFTITDKAGNKIRKTVKDYMITEKIPRQIRDRIPLVAAGSHVLWLTGWRISEAFKVDGDTERVLQVRVSERKSAGMKETEEKDGGEH